MLKNKFYIDVFKILVLICVVVGLCKVTEGGTAILVAVVGALCAIQRKPGYLAICYVIFPVLLGFNREIVGLSPVFLMTARIGNLFMIAAMVLTGVGFQGRVKERLPIMWLFAYCLVACISSIDGWMPLISFLKIAQYILFLMGLLFITRILQQSDEGLYQLRCALMAIAIIFLWGSIIARFVPSVGYAMEIQNASMWGYDIIGSEVLAREGMKLFNGVMVHSQMLAPVSAILGAWVLCDMLLVEKRLTLLHASVFMVAPVLIYMSRSRGGFLELAAVLGMVIFVCVPRARLPYGTRHKLTILMVVVGVGIVVVGIILQFQSQAISKWLRKTDDVSGDDRSLAEAFTGSRQALIEYNLSDFKLNPLLGKGFQVMRGLDRAYASGQVTWYTASVEKGVTPYVILGETGILGAIVFVIFLFSFYMTCLRRRYLALLTMFTCMLAANLADSTFFSPGGGGFSWIMSCVGGFGLDMISIRQAHGVWRGPGARPNLLPPQPYLA